MEEYDFDDYNSIASTASLLNINAELGQNGNNFGPSNVAQLQTNGNNGLWESQPHTAQSKQYIVSGEDESQIQHSKISKVQTSILKVRDWSKTNGNLNKDDWKDIFLESAYEGDLKRLVITKKLMVSVFYSLVFLYFLKFTFLDLLFLAKIILKKC